MKFGRSNHNRQKRMKKASSPVKNNNQLKEGDGKDKSHRKHKEAEKSVVEGLRSGAKNENWPIAS